jgi:hypothetical integral membrane protein (TIGR02206 family)
MDIKEMFWASKIEKTAFPLFSQNHLLALGIIILVLVYIFLNRDAFENEKRRNRFRKVLGVVLILQQSLLYFWYVTSGNFTLGETLPLYTCRIAIFLCIGMLMCESYKCFELAYFWGIAGGIMALMTPDTSGFGFPHLMFVQFFVGHGGMIISLIFMILVYEYKPTKESIYRSSRWTLVYFAIVGVLNYLVDGNYSYLRAKPATATPMDILPIYPYYVPIFIAAFIGSFWLFYAPFSPKLHEKIDDFKQGIIGN